MDDFDVSALADQLDAIGAPCCIVTIGQNSGAYCAPNEAYDSIVGSRNSRCSRRDLVTELYEALSAKSIRLMVYLPAGAPDKDAAACEALGWPNGKYPEHRFVDGLGPDGQRDDRLANFQLK